MLQKNTHTAPLTAPAPSGTKRLATAALAALILAPGSANAGQCINGKSINPVTGLPTGFDHRCQSHTSDSYTVNEQLDDWQRWFDVFFGDNSDPTLNALEAERQRLQARLAELQAMRNARGNAADALLERRRQLQQKRLALLTKAWKTVDMLVDRSFDEFVAAYEDTSADQRDLAIRLHREELAKAENEMDALRDLASSLGKSPDELPLYEDAKATVEYWERVVYELVKQDLLVSQAEELQEQIDALAEDWTKSGKQQQGIEAEIAKVQARIRAIEAQIAASQAPGGGQVTTSSKGGPGGLFSSGKPLAWSTDFSQSDESASPLMTVASTFGIMASKSWDLGNDAGLSFGLGYGFTRSVQTDAFGTGETTMHKLRSRLTAYKTVGAVTFDGSATFDYTWNFLTRPVLTDSYNTHVFGLGAGVNGQHAFAPDMKLDWRLGYAGTWTTRHASVNSLSVPNTGGTTTMQRVSLSGKLTKVLPDGGGKVFGSAKLNYVLADTSVAAFSTSPFDLELGLGAALKLPNGADLDFNVNTGGIGRPGRTSYAASLNYSISF